MDTQTALMKITGDAGIEQQFLQMTHLYDAAIREIRTRLEILDREFSIRYSSNPIHHIDSRLKSPRSIVEKLQRKGLPVSIESAETNLNDIAGVRVICSFPDDVYMIANALLQQDDITLVRQKDYIKNPKPNGYRSLHLIVTVPIYLAKEKRIMKVEIQLRTIAMDFWASLEHQLRYKKDFEFTEKMKKDLLDCANLSAELDGKMDELRSLALSLDE